MLADNGYFSEANVMACTATNIEPVIASQPHHPSWRERFAAPPSARPGFPMCRLTRRVVYQHPAHPPTSRPLHDPPQKLNSIQANAGPVKVDRNNKNATTESIGVSRSPSLSEESVCASVLLARLLAGRGRRTTTPRV